MDCNGAKKTKKKKKAMDNVVSVAQPQETCLAQVVERPRAVADYRRQGRIIGLGVLLHYLPPAGRSRPPADWLSSRQQ